MSFAADHIMTSVGPPQPHPSPSWYVPHSYVMPPQVPTVPSVQPPPSHLPFAVPISCLSQTDTTYLHVPQTHTVVADIHAPFTYESAYTSLGASIVYTQPQTTTVTTQSQSTVTQAVPNSNALPHGMTATADTVVPAPTALPLPMPPTIHSTPTAFVPQTFTQSIPTFIVKQPQLPKPYSGTTSWRSFRKHFERICRVNSWTSTEDKV